MADKILKEKRRQFIQSVGADNVSWRHPTRGSLFIMKLIKTMQEYAWSCDLEEIFRKVRFSFELPDGRAQMPTTERVTLTRCFYLFPGH
uniref:Caspase 1 n=1 Tax=Sciurus vulgaris TaxID=55149 RepID=A0A8D2DGP9_SCIVU